MNLSDGSLGFMYGFGWICGFVGLGKLNHDIDTLELDMLIINYKHSESTDLLGRGNSLLPYFPM